MPNSDTNIPDPDDSLPLSPDERRIYDDAVAEFMQELSASGANPGIFLRKAIQNAAAHAVTCHRTNIALRRAANDNTGKYYAVHARLIAQSAKNGEISTKLLAEIQKQWPVLPSAPAEEETSAFDARYAAHIERFQQLMDQIDIEETARELGCAPHEVPGLPIIVPEPPVATPHPEVFFQEPAAPAPQPAPSPPPPPPRPKRTWTGSPYVF